MNEPRHTQESGLRTFITGLPKAELHVHIEGTLEPELMFELAARNGIQLPHASIETLRAAYAFDDLQSFLDLYYAGAAVLIAERDFYDMTMSYLQKAHDDGVLHAEIMFDPQTHTARAVDIEIVFAGIARAMREMRKTTGISSYLLMSFLRHMSEQEAFHTLNAALPLREQYRDVWIGIGLDSSEQGHPPEKFENVFARCKELGFRLVAHAGEEGPAANVSSALDRLHVERVDHGVRSEEDPALMQRLVRQQVPLTVCPLSNVKLRVVKKLSEHNLARMLRQGVNVTINSDDPAYFGGYIGENYAQATQALALTEEELGVLARNSLQASFLPEREKQALVRKLNNYLADTIKNRAAKSPPEKAGFL